MYHIKVQLNVWPKQFVKCNEKVIAKKTIDIYDTHLVIWRGYTHV